MYRFNEVTKAHSTRLSKGKYDTCCKLRIKAHSNSVAATLSEFAVEVITEIQKDSK